MLAKIGPGRNSELDPAVTAGHRGRERLAQARLADTGHVLDKEVTAGNQAGHREANSLLVALQDLCDVLDDPPEKAGRAGRVEEDLVFANRCGTVRVDPNTGTEIHSLHLISGLERRRQARSSHQLDHLGTREVGFVLVTLVTSPA
jgi:hypothetical protein